MRSTMKFWVLVDVDTSIPAVMQFATFQSQDEAILYAQANPLPGSEQWLPPTGYTLFLNKTNVVYLMSLANSQFGVDTQGKLPVQPQLYTIDPTGVDWNILNPLFVTDTADKWSVLNGRIALDRLKENA
jgi:hypothetical protein